jgi:hypothetical protein
MESSYGMQRLRLVRGHHTEEEILDEVEDVFYLDYIDMLAILAMVEALDKEGGVPISSLSVFLAFLPPSFAVMFD